MRTIRCIRFAAKAGRVPSEKPRALKIQSRFSGVKNPRRRAFTGTRTFAALPAAWDGKNYAALATRLSAAAAALADDIAKNLPAPK